MDKNNFLSVPELADKLKTTPGSIYKQLKSGYLLDRDIEGNLLNYFVKTKSKTFSIRELVNAHPLNKRPSPQIEENSRDYSDDLDGLSYEELKETKIKKEILKIEYQNKLKKIEISQKRGELIERHLVISTVNSYLNLMNQEILDVGQSLGDEVFGIAKKHESAVEGRAAIVTFLGKKLSDIILNTKKKVDKIL